MTLQSSTTIIGQSLNYEACRKNLLEFRDYYNNHKEQLNEASTRFHLIDTLFFECLGWEKDDMEPESSYEGEYADYIFSAPRQMLIVEAKREGNYFELPSGESSRIERSLANLIRDNQDTRNATEQVARYCQKRGVPLGCVCNGHQIIVFIAARQDGKPPLEGKALVFVSLDQMLENFLDLWNALSKVGIQEKNLQSRLLGDILPALPPKLATTLFAYPGVKNRNVFQADLQILSELVIEDITRSREFEKTFLQECYSQSGALSQYALISKSILETRYSAIFNTNSPGPTLQSAVTKSGISPNLLAESLSRRPVLLIGDVGVGKTTFIRNLVKVAAADIFDKAITLYIDLGSQATLVDDLKTFIIKEIERQLNDNYTVNVRADKFVRGIYDLRLREFDEGIYGRLKETHPQIYLENQIKFLEELINDRQEHLRHSLHHISKGRGKQIVIFLDNVDQRDEQIQQQTFLISQEIAEHWLVTIFVTLRPETYHQSIRVGVLSGYHPKAFTISPPRTDRVIERRLHFALKLTSGAIPITALTKNTTVNLERLDIIIRAFLQSLNENEDLIEAIDNISGGNIRLALELVRSFFGSGHIDTEKIYDKFISGGYIIPLHEFIRAVIYGDAVHYDPDKSPVANLFDISQVDQREHFLLSLLIETVSYLGNRSVDQGFVPTAEIYNYLQSIGFNPDQIDIAFIRAQRKRLIETEARRIPQPGQLMPQNIRITTIGKYHTEKLIRDFAYLDAMIVDTPILDRKTREVIRDVGILRDRLERADIFRRYLDEQWQQANLPTSYFDWLSLSSVLDKQIRHIRPYA